MRIKAWAGIDPGISGAIAVVFDGGAEVHDFPGDARALTDLLFHISLAYSIQGVVLEHQQSRPNQSCVATGTAMMNYGQWIQAIADRLWPVEIVRPAQWKSGLGYPAKPPFVPPDREPGLTDKEYAKAVKQAKDRAARKHKDAGKAHSLALARQRFPMLVPRLSRASKDHDRAEALLLALRAVKEFST